MDVLFDFAFQQKFGVVKIVFSLSATSRGTRGDGRTTGSFGVQVSKMELREIAIRSVVGVF